MQGNARTVGTEHNIAHQADAKVKAEGEKKGNRGPKGTAPMGKIIGHYANAAIKVRPDCKDQILEAIRNGYKNVDKKQPGRTTDSLPSSKADDYMHRSGNPGTGARRRR